MLFLSTSVQVLSPLKPHVLKPQCVHFVLEETTSPENKDKQVSGSQVHFPSRSSTVEREWWPWFFPHAFPRCDSQLPPEITCGSPSHMPAMVLDMWHGLGGSIEKIQGPWSDSMKSKYYYYFSIWISCHHCKLQQLLSSSMGNGAYTWSTHLPTRKRVFITSLLCTSPAAGGRCTRVSQTEQVCASVLSFWIRLEDLDGRWCMGAFLIFLTCKEGLPGAEAWRHFGIPRRRWILLNQRNVPEEMSSNPRATNNLRQSNIRENK